MIKKKILILLTIFIVQLTYITVIAEENDNGIIVDSLYNNANKSVVVSGKSGNNSGIAVLLYASKDDELGEICLTEATRTIAGGDYFIEIMPPENFEGGKYILNAVSKDGKSSTTFMWVNENSVNSCLPTINSFTATDDLNNYILLHLDELGIDPEHYSIHQDEICRILLANKPTNGYKDADKFINTYNSALAISLIKTGEDCNSILKKYQTSFPCDLDTAYFNLDSQIRQKFDDIIVGFDFSTTTIEHAFSEMKIRAYIDTSFTWDEIKNSVLGIDNTGKKVNDNFLIINPETKYYDKLKNKDSVFMSLYANKSLLTDINAIKLCFKQYSYEQYQQENKSTGGESGGDSSGGSFKPSSNTISTDVVITAPEEYWFEDTRTHWASDAIAFLYKKGIVNGYPDNLFRPDDTVTRAEFATVLNKVFQFEETTVNVFDDVKYSDWFCEPVNRMASAEILMGYNNRFSPNDSLTREDACVIIYRCMEKFQLLKQKSAKEYEITDSDAISSYAYDAVMYMYDMQIVKGMEDNSFSPKSSITRAQMAQLVKNYYFLNE